MKKSSKSQGGASPEPLSEHFNDRLQQFEDVELIESAQFENIDIPQLPTLKLDGVVKKRRSTKQKQKKQENSKQKKQKRSYSVQPKPQRVNSALDKLVLHEGVIQQKVYVEVFDGVGANAQNLSNVFTDLLQEMGAQVLNKLTNKTQVLVWQYGSIRTLERAKEISTLSIVNPCWTDEYLNVANNNQGAFELKPLLTMRSIPSLASVKDNSKCSPSEMQPSIKQKKEWFKGQKIINIRTEEEIQNLKDQNQRAKSLIVPIGLSICTQLMNLKGQWFDNLSSLQTMKQHSAQFVQRSRTQPTQMIKLLFHKTVYPNIIEDFSNWITTNSVPSIEIIDMAQLDKAKFLITHNLKQFDFLICYFLAREKPIVSLDWCSKIKESDFPIENFIISLPAPQPNLFWPFYFCVFAETPIEEEQNLKLTEIVKVYGGRILKPAFADIMLTMATIKKRKINSLSQKNIKLKIIRAQWIFESIQQQKLLEFEEFRLN